MDLMQLEVLEMLIIRSSSDFRNKYMKYLNAVMIMVIGGDDIEKTNTNKRKYGCRKDYNMRNATR